MPMQAVNGTTLHYELTGTSGVPLVLVHGSWGDHHNWDTVTSELARDYRVLTYDRRGHSASPPAATPGSLREDAMDLAALLEALRLAPAHVVGNSFGAAVSLRLACERPDLFRSLVAHEPPLFALLADEPATREPLAELQRRVEAVVSLLRAGDAVGGARRFVETIALGPGAWDTLPDALRRTFVGNAYTWLDELDDPDWSTIDLAALARLTLPTLLARSDDSPPFFPAVVQRIGRAMRHARLHEFAGGGHMPHRAVPAQYLEVLRAFLREVDARSSVPA
jgi:pimeloyl-ACP methyl ester carboxylesterase